MDEVIMALPDLHEIAPIDLRQLLRMSDDTGMLQHATFGMPDHHHGYCVDDNCRALIASLLHASLRGYDERHVPLHRYLAFIAYAFNEERGRFRNFMSYDRRWLEEVGSEDSHCRTLWALGLAVDLAPTTSIRNLARQLFHNALPAGAKFPYVRSMAFCLLGLHAYLHAQPDDDNAQQLRKRMAERLHQILRENRSDDWPWWEDLITYDNAKLPHALLLAGQALGDDAMRDDALTSLLWLIEKQTAPAPEGHLSIIGNQGWLSRDGHHARFDQQPLEAHALVSACLDAAKVTGDSAWSKRALWAYRWFTGQNDLGQPLYNPESGGCYDGLLPDQVNRNEGAESTLALLLSVLELHRHATGQTSPPRVTAPATLGYAVVGASKFAAFCLEQYQTVDGLASVGVWNRTASRGEAFADRFNLTRFDSLPEMLADPRIHLVHVATIPALHAEHVCAALDAGKHVLCEKPLATNVGDAHRMIQAAATRDRQLGVNFMMRFGPLAGVMQNILTRRLLGAPLRGNVINCAGDGGLPDHHWFWDDKRSGGIFIEHGVHFFDLIDSWLGGGHVTHARSFADPDSGKIDQVVCEVAYGPQTSVNFYHGFHQSHHLDRQRIHIICEQGEIVLRGWVADHLSLRAGLTHAQLEPLRDTLPEDAAIQVTALPPNERIGSRKTKQSPIDVMVQVDWRSTDDKQKVYGRALAELMHDFVQAIRQGDHKLRASAQAGLTALELAADADRMARS